MMLWKRTYKVGTPQLETPISGSHIRPTQVVRTMTSQKFLVGTLALRGFEISLTREVMWAFMSSTMGKCKIFLDYNIL